MKITFLALIIYIFFPILSLSANNVELTKNHKKAIAWECNNDLKKKFDSIDECKTSLFFSLKMDGVLFNLDDFKNKKIKKAEKSCSKRVKVGVYEYRSPSGAEFFSIEYKSGTDADWSVLEVFDNAGESFDFTNYSYDLTGLSGSLFFRFHAYGANSFDLNWHRVDNFSVSAPGRDSRNEYDFMGYNVYVDGTLNNNEVFDSTNYTVYDLNNELQYVFASRSIKSIDENLSGSTGS